MIKKRSSYLLFALITLGLSSCSDTHDDVTDDMIKHLEETGEILTTLAEGGSQEDAIADLKDLSEKGKKLTERMEKLGEPDSEADKKLGEKYDERMNAAQKKVTDATTKLASSGKWTPELQEALVAVMPDAK